MIKQCQKSDCLVLAELAKKLWNKHSVSELKSEFENLLKKSTTFFIDYENNKPIGFAQISLRFDYVEGTNSSPVAYLEGIYVENAFRNNGIAKKLIKECENWARENNCKQLASDCEITNDASYKFHLNCGFEEVNRIICLKKEL